MGKKKSEKIQIVVPAASSNTDEAQAAETTPQEPKTEYQQHQEKFESKAEKKEKKKAAFNSGADKLKDHPKFHKFRKGN